MWFISLIIGATITALVGVFLTPVFISFKKSAGDYFNSLHIGKYLYSTSDLNGWLSIRELSKLEQTDQLDGKLAESFYKDELKTMLLKRGYNNNEEKIKLPYKEIVCFFHNPKKIRINPPAITEEFKLSDELLRATDHILEEVKKKKNIKDDDHPRLSSLKYENNEYVASFQISNYSQQIRTNLSLDKTIIYGGAWTRLRDVDSPDGMLPDFDKSILANAIGVSAIWCMDDKDKNKVSPWIYLRPRKKDVGVYEGMLGMPSGVVECPPQNQFKNDDLVEYLTWEIAREFAEETGIADLARDFDDYSIPIDPKRIGYQTKLEIIPLAFLREVYRGGKPQMFFLIKTEYIPPRKLRKCFKISLGGEEFEKKTLSQSTISAEVISNYLYALSYYQKTGGERVDLTLNRI